MPAYELVKYPDLLAKRLPVDEGWQIVMGKAADDRINTFRSKRMPLQDYVKISR